MLHRRFIGRVLWQSRRQAAIFMLCTALSLVSLVALSGFAESVRRTMIEDARRLQAADVIVRAGSPFSEGLTAAVDRLTAAGRIAAVRVYEFYSVVRALKTDDTLLCQIKVVGAGYPFYGEVQLASGRPISAVLKNGVILAEPALLERLGVRVGDSLHVGDRVLAIADAIVAEPDRPVNFFSLGPRVMAADTDLAAMNLVQHGSRVGYRVLIRVVSAADTPAVVVDLQRAARAGQETVQTARDADSRVKRFFDNLLFFLGLVAIFTLLLAGFGIQSALAALLKDQERTVAIMRAIGATNRFVSVHFLGAVTLIGLAGTALGTAGGLMLQQILPVLFSDLIPAGTALAVMPATLMQGAVLGVGVVTLFAFLPLYRLRDVRPAATLQAAAQRYRRGPAYLAAGGAVTLFFVAMILWQIEDVRTGLYFVAGTGALVGVIMLLTRLTLAAVRRMPTRSLALRQALKGLFRPRNATGAIITTLAAALTVIFATFLIERNLDATFVASFPEDAPNLFFLDIQSSQKEQVAAALGPQAEFYPIVRARIQTINDAAIDRDAERQRRRDNLARTFNLTYRTHLLDDEVLTEGRTLFRDDWPADVVQVSVLERVRRMHRFEVGDRIGFNIQGVPLEATVASIRDRTRDSLKPFFYFVFKPQTLAAAPQTHFAALRVPPAVTHRLQNRIVNRFPNLSAIDASATAQVFGRILRKLSAIVRFFTAFSIFAGLLIIVSSVMATRQARIREAVYFKVLGARQRFVTRVFALENILIGLISAALALAAAQAAAYGVCTRVLAIGYHPYPLAGLVMLAGTVVLVVAVGMAASRGILQAKPDYFLRRQDQGA